MTQNVTTLSSRQLKAIRAILSTTSISAAAKLANVSRKTLYVWLGQSDFRAELDRLSEDVMHDVSISLVSLSSKVLSNLENILDDPKVSVREKIQVSNLILKKSLDFWDLYSLQRRVNQLEKLLNE